MSNYKNPFEPGGKFYNPRITDGSKITEPRIMPRWAEQTEQQQTTIGTKFYDINTGEFIEQINDGINQVVGINIEKYFQLKEEYNNIQFLGFTIYKPNNEIESKYLTDYILSKSGNKLNLTDKEFNELSGTLYAEGSINQGSWEEAAAIYSVLENRKKAHLRTYDINYSIFEIIKKTGVYGWSDKELINSNLASEFAKLNAQKGLILAIISSYDYSNGAYYWHGNDFPKPTPGSSAHENFYLVGFKFTNNSHDIWGIGDKINHEQNTIYINNQAVIKEWNYQYESTAAFGKTTFMKLTQEYKDGQYNDEYENHKPY